MKKFTFQGRWAESEQLRFLEAISVENRSWKEIAKIVGTRTDTQCKSHYQKLDKSLKNRIKIEPDNEKNKVTKVKEESVTEIKECSKYVSKMVQCDLMNCDSLEPLIPYLLNCEFLPTNEKFVIVYDDSLPIPECFDEFLEPLDEFLF
jgi:hypothetical protein